MRLLRLGLVSGLAVLLAQGVFACLGVGGGNTRAVLGIYHHCPRAQIRYYFFFGLGDDGSVISVYTPCLTDSLRGGVGVETNSGP